MKTKQITKDDALKIKALKLVAYLHSNNKNLTKYQFQLVEDLYDVITNWNYGRKHLKYYNLED